LSQAAARPHTRAAWQFSTSTARHPQQVGTTRAPIVHSERGLSQAAAREQSSPHPKNPTLSGLAKRLRVRTPALPPIVQPKMNTGKEPLKCGTAERMAHEFRRCPSF
jgi:hypothetical protein